MSLYGYDLTQYVVETSFGVQPVVWIVLELNPSGWRYVCLVVANTHKAQEGVLGGLVVANTSGETAVGTLQARGSVNMLGPHDKMEMLAIWKQGMKSLLMENVYNLCRV
jgi:hypothetical protein